MPFLSDTSHLARPHLLTSSTNCWPNGQTFEPMGAFSLKAPLLKANIRKIKAKHAVLMVSFIWCFPILSGSQGVEGSSTSCKQILPLCKHTAELITQWEQFFALKLKKRKKGWKITEGKEGQGEEKMKRKQKETNVWVAFSRLVLN